jgi:hypothetical protein
MDLGERKQTVEVKSSHRHGMSYTAIPNMPTHDKESLEKAVNDERKRSFYYNRNGVKCVIKPIVSNVYGKVNRTTYEVEVATYAKDDDSAYMEGEWEDSSCFKNYAEAVEWAMGQVHRRINAHNGILESLSALSTRLPEVMLEDGHGDDEEYEQEQNGMDEDVELESMFTFGDQSENVKEENPNVDAKVVRKI